MLLIAHHCIRNHETNNGNSEIINFKSGPLLILSGKQKQADVVVSGYQDKCDTKMNNLFR